MTTNFFTRLLAVLIFGGLLFAQAPGPGPAAISPPSSGGLPDTGSNGIVNRTGLNTTAPATGHNVAAVLTCATSSNSGTAETCSTSPSFTPASGDCVVFQADIASTGAFTLNVNSLGAKSVKKNGTTALIANDILASPFSVLLCLDSTATNWEMQGQAGNGAGTTSTIASGALTLNTTAVASASCSTAQTATATGAATTDAIIVSFNGDPTAVTGYVPLTTGMLTIIPYPTSNTVNFKVCNNTSASITPGAVTLNWRLVR